MMTVIRRADPTDIPWLLEQLRAFDAFFSASFQLFPNDEHYARAFLMRLVEDEQHAFFIAQNDVRTGFIAGVVGPHSFNPEWISLNEVFWWVRPDLRGSTVGGRLLIEFEEFGRRAGVHTVCVTLETKTIELGLINPKSLIARGYIEKERAYLLELPRVPV